MSKKENIFNDRSTMQNGKNSNEIILKEYLWI